MPYIKHIKINPSELVPLPKKEPKVQDPIRFPAVVEPIENKFINDYDKMLGNMQKMLSMELVKQIKNI